MVSQRVLAAPERLRDFRGDVGAAEPEIVQVAVIEPRKIAALTGYLAPAKE